jgi:hypothetical protein
MQKKQITYQDFLIKVHSFASANNWKIGQAYFNLLSNYRPEIAEMLRGTLHDPFHRDYISHETEALVKSNWY